MIVTHNAVCFNNVIGLDGYNIDKDSITVLIAEDGNHFLDKGIVEGSFLICAKGAVHSKGELLVVLDDEKGFRLERNLTSDMKYYGKIIMTIKTMENKEVNENNKSNEEHLNDAYALASQVDQEAT